MQSFKSILFSIGLILVFVMTSCKTKTDQVNIPVSSSFRTEIEIPRQAMEEIIDNVSSPIEIAALIKDLGISFNPEHLSDPDKLQKVNDDFNISYHLGVLGADLGYLNVYEKTARSFKYLNAIRELSIKLQISQFFDFETLRELAAMSSNLDSLMYLSVRSFNRMDNYLRETNRSHLSALMIAGIWIEGMYQATQVVNENQDPLLSEYIGAQKVIMNDLILILKHYQDIEQFKPLIKDFEEIKADFNKVNISYEIGKPETTIKDGMLVVIQNEKSIVDINSKVLNNIIKIIETKRNHHLSVQE